MRKDHSPNPWAALQGRSGLRGSSGEESVTILGSGTAGLLCLQYVLHFGAGPVFATDSNEYKLSKAMEFGATLAFSSGEDIASLVRENNSGYLSDMVIVCTGAQAAIKSAFELVSPSGKILFFAPSDPEFTLDFPFNEYWWSGVRVVSSYAAAPRGLAGRTFSNRKRCCRRWEDDYPQVFLGRYPERVRSRRESRGKPQDHDKSVTMARTQRLLLWRV